MDEPKIDIRKEIVELAMLQFFDDEIAAIMEMDKAELLKKYSDAIDKGRLLAEAEVRRSILQLAKQGSTPAQKQFLELNAAAKKKRR